jgi:hypothetical protein
MIVKLNLYDLKNLGTVCCLLLAFILIAPIANAQVTPIYFSGKDRVLDKDIADSYAITGKLSNRNLWMFKQYDLDNNLLVTGSYKDENFSIPHGNFIYYTYVDSFNDFYDTFYDIEETDRFKYIEGAFVDGLRQGLWKTYYPDGTVRIAENYNKNLKDGLYELFDGKGKLLTSGNFVLGKKQGEWLSKSGKLIEVYKDNQLVPKKIMK